MQPLHPVQHCQMENLLDPSALSWDGDAEQLWSSLSTSFPFVLSASARQFCAAYPAPNFLYYYL